MGLHPRGFHRLRVALRTSRVPREPRILSYAPLPTLNLRSKWRNIPVHDDLLSRRDFLVAATAAVPLSAMGAQIAQAPAGGQPPSGPSPSDRIVDIHVHFDEKIPTFLDDFLRASDKVNLTAYMLIPFAHRKVVAEAARKHPTKIIPFGYVELDGRRGAAGQGAPRSGVPRPR